MVDTPAWAREAVTAFATRNGRLWKSKLGEVWATGQYWRYGAEGNEAGILQSIRNHPSLSHEWLKRVKL